eukprot:3521785-Prymnesium_polylepis.2
MTVAGSSAVAIIALPTPMMIRPVSVPMNAPSTGPKEKPTLTPTAPAMMVPMHNVPAQPPG